MHRQRQGAQTLRVPSKSRWRPPSARRGAGSSCWRRRRCPAARTTGIRCRPLSPTSWGSSAMRSCASPPTRATVATARLHVTTCGSLSPSRAAAVTKAIARELKRRAAAEPVSQKTSTHGPQFPQAPDRRRQQRRARGRHNFARLLAWLRRLFCALLRFWTLLFAQRADLYPRPAYALPHRRRDRSCVVHPRPPAAAAEAPIQRSTVGAIVLCFA